MKRALLSSTVMMLAAILAASANAQQFDRRMSGMDAPARAEQAARVSGQGASNVVAGPREPDYLHPWVVALPQGCRGTLIHPQWVLTAAHCVTQGLGSNAVSYERVDPFTGRVESGRREAAGPGANSHVYLHPDFDPNSALHDIALIKLASPFPMTTGLQTAALPGSARVPGRIGTTASFDHNETLPRGQVAIFRAPIPQSDFAPRFTITAAAANAALCPGDSGSGFVVMENGRAVVRGVASTASVTDCTSAEGEADFTDVFAHRSWILQTMAADGGSFASNTRLRRSGRTARGVIGIGCFNPHGTLWGPLHVAGVEEAANCEAGQTQTVTCVVDEDQGSSQNRGLGPPAITRFTMRSIAADGSVQEQSLPFTARSASYYGVLPANVRREFMCQIGGTLAAPIAPQGTLTRRD